MTVSLDANTDSGTSGDKLTNHQTPTFSGQTEANSTVTLNIAGQSLHTKADAKGIWRITVEKPLTDKEHNYTVAAVDVAGNTKTVTETVTIKTTLPDATAQLAGKLDFLTNQTTPTLTGQTEPKVNIQVNIAGHIYSTQADDKGIWSLPIPDALADGVHTFNVKVIDQAGNVGIFSESLQIDT